MNQLSNKILPFILFTLLLGYPPGISCDKVPIRGNTRQNGQYWLGKGDELYKVSEKSKQIHWNSSEFEGAQCDKANSIITRGDTKSPRSWKLYGRLP